MKQSNWVSFIDNLQYCINSAHHFELRQSAFRLYFGRDPIDPLLTKWEIAEKDLDANVNVWVTAMLNIEKIWEDRRNVYNK